MSQLIRDARRRRGATIYDLADMLAVTPGAVSQLEKSEREGNIRMSSLQRALGALGEELRLTSAPTTMASRHLMSARTAATAIAAELSRQDLDAAIRLVGQAIEHFRQAHTPTEIADFLRKPTAIGDLRWDTLLATAIRWEADQRGINPPRWTRRQPLAVEWMPGINTDASDEYRAYIRSETPSAFRAVNILMRERDLANR